MPEETGKLGCFARTVLSFAAVVLGLQLAFSFLNCLKWNYSGCCIPIYSSLRRGHCHPVAEGQALHLIHEVVSAQEAYRSANRGQFEGRLECLARPWDCIPAYPAKAPVFLDPSHPSLRLVEGSTHSWGSKYEWKFYPGKAPDEFNEFASASSVESWAIVATPLPNEGFVSFCEDSTRLRCYSHTSRPRVDGAHCATDSSPSVGGPSRYRHLALCANLDTE